MKIYFFKDRTTKTEWCLGWKAVFKINRRGVQERHQTGWRNTFELRGQMLRNKYRQEKFGGGQWKGSQGLLQRGRAWWPRKTPLDSESWGRESAPEEASAWSKEQGEVCPAWRPLARTGARDSCGSQGADRPGSRLDVGMFWNKRSEGLLSQGNKEATECNENMFSFGHIKVRVVHARGSER